MKPFATHVGVAARWPGYDEGDAAVAATMLRRVSVRLAAMLSAHGVAVDAGGGAQAAVLEDVTCEVVRRLLSAQGVAHGMPVGQLTETATPYSNSYIFSNANGDVYLTRRERGLLGLTGGRAAFAPPVAP